MASGVNRLQGLVAADPSDESAGEASQHQTRLDDGVRRARDYLLEQQHAEGFWVGELEGDTILESEYTLLLAYLGRSSDPLIGDLARYILDRQLPEGGWSLYPGGPLELSASVKAYWTLKIAGYDRDDEPMQRARRAIREAGGAERVNSFTRYYFALLGIIAYHQCPAVPPELMLIPSWAPLNIYEMSAWSRTILVPLSLLWAYQPSVSLPAEHRFDELFLDSPERLPVSMPPSESLDAMKRKTYVPWDRIFRTIDLAWKGAEACRMKPMRKRAIALAAQWMKDRLIESDGLGAIFPPIIWSVVALKCLGHSDDSPEVRGALHELEKLFLRDDAGRLRLQPCLSPVWDTAIATIALREAGVSSTHGAIRRAVDWLLAKEVRQRGDWSVRNPSLPPAGWFFEFNNVFYPDVDDTAMVTMALAAALPNSARAPLRAALVTTGPQGHTNEANLSAVIDGRTDDLAAIEREVTAMAPPLGAITRGARWMLGMQSANGGWGAFDRDNDRELLTRVPFADHNAMIDPPTADITARTLEMFGRLGVDPDHPALLRALEFVWQEQEPDGAWYGRWGVNYIYGTWQVLVGLREFGVPHTDSRLQAAVRWLKEKQHASGAWGESPRSYDDPHLRGCGPPTASQTAWALMGLMAGGEVHSRSTQRGIDYLLKTQRPDGGWDEEPYTGTGFPRVFYLRYHLYRIYFPLMALARYQRLSRQPAE